MGYRPPMYYQTFVPAPTEEPKTKKKWEPPKEPARKLKLKTRQLIEDAKYRLEREKMQQRADAEEAAEALRDVDEEDEMSKYRQVFYNCPPPLQSHRPIY